ncbi:MAG: hypothetical protein PHP74_04035 [Candidatus Gracilibacteria bacterium]|nr:hypothetical protein [Candidatus Gracilibacteria bacterium]
MLVISRNTGPVFTSLKISLATIFLGASSFSGWRLFMNLSFFEFMRGAPSPRTVSEIRNLGEVFFASADGGNCINSKSSVLAPIREAIAIPSPVAISGLVVFS